MGMWDQIEMLDDKIDHKKTRDRVQKFLAKSYPRFKRLARVDLVSLQSPQLSGMPKGSPSGNPAEERLVNRAAARQVVQQTEQAIQACDRDSQEILRLMIAGYKAKEIIARIGWSKSQYNDHLKPKALDQFAEAYQGEALVVKEPEVKL